MIRGNIILCVLFAVFVIQAQVTIGFPLDRRDLQLILRNALKLQDCARIVPVSDPIPLRFRRATNRGRFQCLITV